VVHLRDHDVQQADLDGGQRKGAGRAGDAAPGQVDLEVAAVKDDLRVAGRGASEDALHACDQLIGLEGLGDVVLGVVLERPDLGLGGVDGGEDDDREVGDPLDPGAQLEAVHAGHHQVDDQQRRPALLELLERLGARGRGQHLVALARHSAREDGEKGWVVIDQQEGRPERRLHLRCRVRR
jgi:hypothetical protein